MTVRKYDVDVSGGVTVTSDYCSGISRMSSSIGSTWIEPGNGGSGGLWVRSWVRTILAHHAFGHRATLLHIDLNSSECRNRPSSTDCRRRYAWNFLQFHAVRLDHHSPPRSYEQHIYRRPPCRSKPGSRLTSPLRRLNRASPVAIPGSGQNISTCPNLSVRHEQSSLHCAKC